MTCNLEKGFDVSEQARADGRRISIYNYRIIAGDYWRSGCWLCRFGADWRIHSGCSHLSWSYSADCRARLRLNDRAVSRKIDCWQSFCRSFIAFHVITSLDKKAFNRS